MRFAIALLLLVAGPAHAQTERDRAHDMIAASIVAGGFDTEIAAYAADCYVTRMTDAEIAALVAAEGDVAAQQAVIAGIAQSGEALGCLAAAIP
ncbi:hypothetical protein HKCCSP123_04315 [Rhodobacterales bacterium HKCCSP123]|nr:hypothetical protein [Rhodobacterales bacterium HKCCSP123]